MTKTPIRVAVTGAAGQIGYSLLFRIAAGDMLGDDQPVILQLLEIPAVLPKLQGVVMELEDCAFPLLHGMVTSDKPGVAFRDADIALLVGARPRTEGMTRRDLLDVNAPIFTVQGRALNEFASRNVRVLAVGNPANTNALIALKNAPALKPEQFTSMMRLDHNRTISQLAIKIGKPVVSIRKVIVWGNHSGTQYPDLFHAEADRQKVWPVINDEEWLKSSLIPIVQKRGDSIIRACGASSAASAGNAVIEHIRDWMLGTQNGDWVTMGVPADGSYGISEGVMYGSPVTCKGGSYQIVQDLPINEFSRERMNATLRELREERDEIKQLLA